MNVLWGALLALGSAATFGFNNAALRRGVLRGSVVQALAITVPMGIPLFLVAAVVTGELLQLLRFGTPVILALGAAGILHFGVGRYANYRATQAMGSNLSGTIQEMNLVVSLVLAVTVLREQLSALQLAGVVLIVLASIVIRDRPEDLATATFAPNVTQGYVYSLITAIAYGTTPVLVRAALSGTSLPMAAGLISYVAATLAFALFVAFTRSAAHIRAVPREALPWFVVSGVFVGFSQVFRYAALSLAPVTVVSPIQRLSLLFRVIFSTTLNRDYEAWNVRVLVSVFVALLGGLAVALG